MSYCQTSATAIVLILSSVAQADDATIKKTAKSKAEEINAALMKEDFAKIVDLTHEKAVEMAGGSEKMIKGLKTGFSLMKSQGFTLQSSKVELPTEVFKDSDAVYTVVPFQLEYTSSISRMVYNSFMVGISKDQGKTWVFLSGDQEPAKIRMILPALPAKLVLPAKQKPVIEKK